MILEFFEESYTMRRMRAMAKTEIRYVIVNVLNDKGESHQIGVRVHDAAEVLSGGSMWGREECGYTARSRLGPEPGEIYEREIYISIPDNGTGLLHLKEGSRFMQIRSSDFFEFGFARFIGVEKKPEPAPAEA